jgi:hypothetical protein
MNYELVHKESSMSEKEKKKAHSYVNPEFEKYIQGLLLNLEQFELYLTMVMVFSLKLCHHH